MGLEKTVDSEATSLLKFMPPGSRSEPVFVLGATRSATTLISDALMKVGWGGFREGHLLQLLIELNGSIEAARRLHEAEAPRSSWAIDEFPIDMLSAGILAYFEDFHVQRFGVRWLDKTPGSEAIRLAPLLMRLFPCAKFVVCLRRGVDVIASATRRFVGEHAGVRNACDQWVESMMQWNYARPLLGGQAIEVEHSLLRSNPDLVASELAGFLGLSDEACFRLADTFKTSTPEATSADPSPLILQSAPWSRFDKDYVVEKAAYCMSLFGYGFDDPFVARSKERALPFSRDPRVVDTSQLDSPDLYKHVGRDRFLLHPASQLGSRSEIVFRNQDARGYGFFSARVSVEHPNSAPVRCGTRLASSAEVLVEVSCECSWGTPNTLLLPIPNDCRGADLVLWSEMSDPQAASSFAWCNFQSCRWIAARPL